MEIIEFMMKFKKEMDDALNKATSNLAMKELGLQVVGMIYKRVKLGYSVGVDGGTKVKLAPLTDGYKKMRGKQTLSSTTTKGKSNLTNTGDMLQNLGVVSTSNGKVTIGFTSPELKKRADHVSESRPFMHLSSVEMKRLEADIKEKLKKELDIAIKNLK